jgi:hypothetical protein
MGRQTRGSAAYPSWLSDGFGPLATNVILEVKTGSCNILDDAAIAG